MRGILLGVSILLASVVGGLLWWLYTPDKQRALLEAEYARPPSMFLDVAGLHGFGASLQTWDDWARDLERDHRVIRYDLPGFGLTGPDPTGDYTDARSIMILLVLMDRLGAMRASVVGNSMGGRIAWTFAALHPERTDKLVLVSPDGFASPGEAYGVSPKLPLMVLLLPYVLPSARVTGNSRSCSDCWTEPGGSGN
jgi:pimeloyl-ACP methyl ester carboxylesterase